MVLQYYLNVFKNIDDSLPHYGKKGTASDSEAIMDDSLDDNIVAFAKLPPASLNPADIMEETVSSTRTIYYEWSRIDKKWNKLNEEDPDPNQSSLPQGLFDGQIIEVETPI
jgi:hypothetical protein